MKKGPGIIAWLRARWRAARREDELERWAIGRARQFDMLHEYNSASRYADSSTSVSLCCMRQKKLPQKQP